MLETGTDVATTGVNEDHFGRTQIDEHAVVSDPAEPPCPDGHAITWDVSATKYKGRFRTRLVDETAQNLQSGGAERGKLFYSDTVEQAATTDTAPPAQVNGKIISFQYTPTKWKGRYRTQKVTRGATAYDSGWSYDADYHGYSFKRYYKNQLVVPPANLIFEGRWDLESHDEINDYGLHDGWYSARQIPGPAKQGDDWNDFTISGITRKDDVTREFNGKHYVGERIVTYSVTQTGNAQTAYNFIRNGKNGSDVEHLGHAFYRATKVTDVQWPSTWEEIPEPA